MRANGDKREEDRDGGSEIRKDIYSVTVLGFVIYYFVCVCVGVCVCDRERGWLLLLSSPPLSMLGVISFCVVVVCRRRLLLLLLVRPWSDETVLFSGVICGGPSVCRTCGHRQTQRKRQTNRLE